GIDLTNVDAAAVLGLGDTTGLLIGDVVANGQGDISQTAIYANVYYDFALDSPIQPYVGAGLGIADVDVKFNPSDVGIIDDSETKLAYQFKAGVTYKLANQWEVFGEYAYRATEDIEVNNDLFPGTLDIENEQNVFSFGARYRFGAHSAS
ncbi:MAG: outer membrane beta-barrel protein, partial [Pseudomonadota bacterium]